MEHGKGPGEEGARIREPLASPCGLTQVPGGYEMSLCVTHSHCPTQDKEA